VTSARMTREPSDTPKRSSSSMGALERGSAIAIASPGCAESCTLFQHSKSSQFSVRHRVSVATPRRREAKLDDGSLLIPRFRDTASRRCGQLQTAPLEAHCPQRQVCDRSNFIKFKCCLCAGVDWCSRVLRR
jgi:hypothetical protein